MIDYILDSSVIIAVFYNENGISSVKPLLKRAGISTVNFAECISTLARRGIPTRDASETISELVGAVLPFEKDCATMAGELAVMGKAFGLSLGDRACIATGIIMGLEVITADKIWAKIDAKVKIRLIR